jgi:hypothetical protein
MATRFGLQTAQLRAAITVERQHITVGPQKLSKPVLEELALLPRRKSLDPRGKLIDPYRGQRNGPSQRVTLASGRGRVVSEMTFVSSR